MGDAVTMLCIALFIHCAILFFNVVFKSCCLYPYFKFLKKSGIEISFLTIKCSTTIFNRPLQKWGIWRPRFLKLWFTAGTYVSLLLLPISLTLLIRSLILTISQRGTSEPTTDAASLELVIPGYNLPLSDLGYYSISMLLCTVVHEIGHAVAAVREDVHIYGTGFLLVFIFPAACVNLDSDRLGSLPPMRRLRILCAGVWHNLLLAVYAAIIVFSLPILTQPFYTTGEGVYVMSISPDSPATGPSGLLEGDVVTSINQCSVARKSAWKKCIADAHRYPTPGYCISAEFVRENDESAPDHPTVEGAVACCPPQACKEGRLCFQLVDDSGGPVALPEYSCLLARKLVKENIGYCANQSPNYCSSQLHCLRPSVVNNTKLLAINRVKGEVVLFLGNPTEIYSTVQVVDYVPKWNIYDPYIPQFLENLLKYVCMMSSGLAVVNVLPAFFFDGQYIASTLCDLFLGSRVKDNSKRLAISLCTSFCGTVLLLTALITPIVLQYIY
ncbi:membrane-bound transcription factor site-2 protease [Thrips palmi]|uniref:Membrane-bound transcription factor site-2 protease n=1 Tax=Thrips palmi TaxID=161013 RepID=A0A6P9A6B2_THRPL|nr:membrane-bound transcription factor site-2 protease [Thrips palmi]